MSGFRIMQIFAYISTCFTYKIEILSVTDNELIFFLLIFLFEIAEEQIIQKWAIQKIRRAFSLIIVDTLAPNSLLCNLQIIERR